ncbi:hypothetical protein EDB19DRAFT_1704708 [Suillus lakei]|nr:hypothetical protein EDB19DRAFT_1704708 [Suillus lakei]
MLMSKSSPGREVLSTDIMHREILDNMLATPLVSTCRGLGGIDREDPDMIWPNLDVYQHTAPGLTELKHHVNILTLSSGNVRLLLGLVVELPRYASGLSIIHITGKEPRYSLG